MNNTYSSYSIFKRIAAIQSEWDLLSDKEKARRRHQFVEWSELLKSGKKNDKSRNEPGKNNLMEQ